MAVRVNHGDPAILASRDAPGSVLAVRCAAKAGTIPLYGQQGRFTLEVGGSFTFGKFRWHSVVVRIALDGMFGIGSLLHSFPGFAAHAIDDNRPFISPSGFRSFLGPRFDPGSLGPRPDSFCRAVIRAYIEDELKGKLVRIEDRYRTPSPGV